MVDSCGDRKARIECERGNFGGSGGLSYWNSNEDIGSCRGLRSVSQCKRVEGQLCAPEIFNIRSQSSKVNVSIVQRI